MEKPFFSIIIPVKSLNEYVHETVGELIKQRFDLWELFIVTNADEPNPWLEDGRIHVFPSGRVAPGRKRDIAAADVVGEVIVFLDDDSYPASDFLINAKQVFDSASIRALGGPGVTPESDSFLQRSSGCVFLSKYSGGHPERYRGIGPRKIVSDWPSVNLMIRTSVFQRVGGFGTDIWPGEDTVLCSKLNNANFDIVYEPSVLVFHHRRGGISSHLKQIAGYGMKRGYLVARLDGNSLHLKYAFPAFLLLFLVCSPIVAFIPSLWPVFALGYSLVALLLVFCFRDFRRFETLSVSLMAITLVLPTFLVYGAGYLIGLGTKVETADLR